MSTPELQNRLAELETRLTFVDDTVNALADADAMQSRRMLSLEQAMRDLRTELSSMRSAIGSDAQDEPPPPHY